MINFVSLHPDTDCPGTRMRLQYASDGYQLAQLLEERVLPEQVLNADARNLSVLAGPLPLAPSDVEWLHTATGDLLATMLPDLTHDAAADRRITGGTDRLRAISAVLQAALEWRRGGRVAPLIAALDLLVAEGHALPVPEVGQ